jgi:hypothetical protein
MAVIRREDLRAPASCLWQRCSYRGQVTVVETILEGLADASRLFGHGTMEERKRVVRAFVEGITIDAASQSAELTMKKLPEPDLAGAGSSFVLVAGAGFEPATFGL